MGRLPDLSGADAVQIFERAGWTSDRQRGSHVILVKDGHIATLSVWADEKPTDASLPDLESTEAEDADDDE